MHHKITLHSFHLVHTQEDPNHKELADIIFYQSSHILQNVSFYQLCLMTSSLKSCQVPFAEEYTATNEFDSTESCLYFSFVRFDAVQCLKSCNNMVKFKLTLIYNNYYGCADYELIFTKVYTKIHIILIAQKIKHLQI